MLGWDTRTLKSSKKKQITKTTEKKLKSTRCGSELKVTNVPSSFNFSDGVNFIFRERILLKCGMLPHFGTFHLSAFQSFLCRLDLGGPRGG